MTHVTRVMLVAVFFFAGSSLIWPGTLQPQSTSIANNPYQAQQNWEQLPEGMDMGVVSGIFPDPDGRHLWFLSRCGIGDGCAARPDIDPILKLDLDGKLVDSFGAGIFAYPHGFWLDHEGYLWVTEGGPHGDPRTMAGYERGLGHQVFKLNQSGEVLMTLGVAGVYGDDEFHFNGPADVLVDLSGNIWIVDGHRGGNNRLVKFSPAGEFLFQRGGGIESRSREPGTFDDPHGLAMDSQGRIFVADRGNNRIQMFDQDGDLLDIWTQFGKPSGIAIDRNDILYAVDGLSNRPRADWRSNPGWEPGIRVGSVTDGWVTAFIPIPADFTGTEFIGVDFDGNIYGNDLARETVVKFSRFR